MQEIRILLLDQQLCKRVLLEGVHYQIALRGHDIMDIDSTTDDGSTIDRHMNDGLCIECSITEALGGIHCYYANLGHIYKRL